MNNKLLDRLNQAQTEEERITILLQNYFQKENSQELSEAFRAVAIPHWFNESILAALIPNLSDKVDKIYQQLIKLPFVQDFPTRGHNIYQPTRKVILSGIWEKQRAEFFKLSELASEFFQNYCKNQLEAQIEYLYHLILVDSSKGAKEVKLICTQWESQFRFAELDSLLNTLSEQVDEKRVRGAAKAVILYLQAKNSLRLKQDREDPKEIIKTLLVAEKEADREISIRVEIQQEIEELRNLESLSLENDLNTLSLDSVTGHSKVSQPSSVLSPTKPKVGKGRTSSNKNHSRGKKNKKNIPIGVAHIQSTFNNTIVTISDTKGDVISWSSAGASGFKGAKKGTPFAAQTAADSAGRRAMDQGMRQIEVMVSGPGAGRETAIRALEGVGLEVTLIRDVTPIPHNGCRPPKRRRV